MTYLTQYDQYNQQYPSSAPEPMFWTAFFQVMFGLVMLAVYTAWGVSQIKKAFKGEEIEKPSWGVS